MRKKGTLTWIQCVFVYKNIANTKLSSILAIACGRAQLRRQWKENCFLLRVHAEKHWALSHKLGKAPVAHNFLLEPRTMYAHCGCRWCSGLTVALFSLFLSIRYAGYKYSSLWKYNDIFLHRFFFESSYPHTLFLRRCVLVFRKQRLLRTPTRTAFIYHKIYTFFVANIFSNCFFNWSLQKRAARAIAHWRQHDLLCWQLFY